MIFSGYQPVANSPPSPETSILQLDYTKIHRQTCVTLKRNLNFFKTSYSPPDLGSREGYLRTLTSGQYAMRSYFSRNIQLVYVVSDNSPLNTQAAFGRFTIFLQIFNIPLEKVLTLHKIGVKYFLAVGFIPSVCIVWYSGGSVTAQGFTHTVHRSLHLQFY